MIDQEKIVQFVDAVETRKGFVKDKSLILRHMISELGELDRAVYEAAEKRGMVRKEVKRIADECLDIIFLACYMASVFGLNLNERLRARMKAIAGQYDVRINIPGICSFCFCSDFSPCPNGCSLDDFDSTICSACVKQSVPRHANKKHANKKTNKKNDRQS